MSGPHEVVRAELLLGSQPERAGMSLKLWQGWRASVTPRSWPRRCSGRLRMRPRHHREPDAHLARDHPRQRPRWPPKFTRPASASARPVSTALASALFFGGLATTGGDYQAAVERGLASPAVLVGVASLIGTADILWPSRGAPEDGSKESSGLSFPPRSGSSLIRL